ncbi:MAG: hypothetical protein CR994_04295 [Maribacter sp.]|nr:MAG: hypothetical protein CR994_04295 [Maribacter sp.]
MIGNQSLFGHHPATKIGWPSSSLDEGIASYDIYLDTVPGPKLLLTMWGYTGVGTQPFNRKKLQPQGFPPYLNDRSIF